MTFLTWTALYYTMAQCFSHFISVCLTYSCLAELGTKHMWLMLYFFRIQIALYSIILFCVFLWIPFVYFYYEERDDDNGNKCSVRLHLSPTLSTVAAQVHCWGIQILFRWFRAADRYSNTRNVPESFHLNFPASSRQHEPICSTHFNI